MEKRQEIVNKFLEEIWKDKCDEWKRYSLYYDELYEAYIDEYYEFELTLPVEASDIDIYFCIEKSELKKAGKIVMGIRNFDFIGNGTKIGGSPIRFCWHDECKCGK